MSIEKHSSRPYGVERQFQVYMAGLGGRKPTIPVSPEELEREANERMTPEARGYLSGMPDTMQSNLAVFRHWQIVPRMLRDVSERDLRISLLGMDLPFPILLAPIGVQSLLHAEAEVAVARAAAAVGVPLMLSTASSKSLEEVATAMGETLHWFQLYWSKDRDVTASLVRRAEQAGYKAIVVTLDTGLLGWREQDIQNAYLPFLRGEGLANYLSDPVFRQSLQKVDPPFMEGRSSPSEAKGSQAPEEDFFATAQRFVAVFANPALRWQDLSFLREHTSLPILLKGIVHPDDARKALEFGMNGIIVSNHGGRQVNGACAALDALPRVVEAVQGEIPLLFDSGIRRGSDIIKALALGAQAVLLGRPYLWGLALAGEEGVREVLLNLLADLDLTLALSGYRSCKELDSSALVKEAPSYACYYR